MGEPREIVVADQVEQYHRETCNPAHPATECGTDYALLAYRAGLRHGARLYRQGFAAAARERLICNACHGHPCMCAAEVHRG